MKRFNTKEELEDWIYDMCSILVFQGDADIILQDDDYRKIAAMDPRTLSASTLTFVTPARVLHIWSEYQWEVKLEAARLRKKEEE